MEKHFAGKNGYVWWTGVIIDRKDPANLGRCKVRIIGWHDENRNKVPVEDLPWAQILLPVNSSKSISLPKEGDWVSGFFLDAENGQMPVINGVYPGIVTSEVREYSNGTELLFALESKLIIEKTRLTDMMSVDGYGESAIEGQKLIISDIEKQISAAKTALKRKSNIPWTDERSQEEINKGPRLPTDVVGYVQDEPTITRIGRGIVEGSVVDKTNKDRKHVCDITGQIAPVVLYLKNKYGIIATEIRETIRKILKALGFDPSGESSALISYIKKITNFLYAIAEMLEEVLDWKRLIVDVAAAAKAMIDYIMSLPEKLYNLFKKCLKNLYAQLYAAFKFITDVGTEDKLFSEDPELKEALKELEDTGKILRDQTKELLQAPQEILDAATKPASQESLDEIESLILDAIPSTEEISSNAGFDKTETEAP